MRAFASTPKSLNPLLWKTRFFSFLATRNVVTRTARLQPAASASKHCQIPCMNEKCEGVFEALVWVEDLIEKNRGTPRGQ